MTVAGNKLKPQRRRTRQGVLIEQAVMALRNHPSARAVHASLSEEGVAMATVYRQLARMVEEGVLNSFEHLGETRYDTNLEPHAHAVCTACEQIWDVPLPEMEGSEPHALPLATIENVDITFRGLCPACARKQ